MVDCDFLVEKLSELNITENKQKEILKNGKISHILEFLFRRFNPNKLHYNVASKIPAPFETDANLILIGDLIDRMIIKNERSILGIFNYLNKNITNVSPEEYINSFDKPDEYILEIINKAEHIEKTKKELSKYLNNHEELRYTSTASINTVVDYYLKNKPVQITSTFKANNNSEYKWLLEGELSRIHMPDTNPLNNKEILQAHLKRTNSRVITRFPPEPNGFLHIGHAKALNLSYNFSKMYNGEFILRYDDTNPKNEKEDYYKNIMNDCVWLLGDKNESVFTRVTHASDYFDRFIDLGFELIRKEKAFVCNQTQEEMKKSREINEESPYRNRNKDLNLCLFREMIDGKWKEGTISLRLKMDMQSKNPLMHDLVAFRVIDHPHFRTKNKFKIYPSYDFTHCINDSFEDITHSFCSREFYNRKESYYWLLEELGLYKPVQWEFSRLNIEDTMLSKRKIIELIETGVVSGWNDPRLYTLCALRRRGFTPNGINKFVKNVGITFNVTTIELKALENFIREDLLVVAKKMSCVVDPLRVFIKDTLETIYIERSDFSTKDTPDFLRLTPNQPVGLLSYGTIKVIEYNENKIIAERTDEKAKKYIHFVKDFIEVELRFYDKLFINGILNGNSLTVKRGYCEKEILCSKEYDLYQFLRVGFFCVDGDSKPDNMVLNLTLPLKNSTWN